MWDAVDFVTCEMEIGDLLSLLHILETLLTLNLNLWGGLVTFAQKTRWLWNAIVNVNVTLNTLNS